MACYYYTLNISQLDIDAATGNFSQPDYTVFVNYTDCNGDPQTTSFGLAGIYTDAICVDEFSFPNIYYYTNDNASLATYSTSSQEGLCSAAETPTPTPTFVPPTPTPTPTTQGTCWTIKIANGDAPLFCDETNNGSQELYIKYTDNSGVFHNDEWSTLPFNPFINPGYNTYYLCLQNSTSPAYAYGPFGFSETLLCSTQESFGSCFGDAICAIPPTPTPTNTPTTTTTLTATPTQTPTNTPTQTPTQTRTQTPTTTTTLTATPTRTPTQTPTPNACWNYTFGPNTFSTTYEYWTCSTDQSNLLFVAANTTVGPYCSARVPTGGAYTRLDVCGSIPPTPTPTPTPSTTTTLTATPTRTPTQTPTLPTAYPYLGRTTPDAGNSADACTSYLTVRPYFVAKSSLASIVVGDRFYDSYPSTPTNGGNNWVALKSSGVGTAYSFQIDTSGYVIQVGGACAPDPTPTSTTTLTATQTPTQTQTQTQTPTATPYTIITGETECNILYNGGSGGRGYFEITVQLGSGTGTINFDFDAYTVPDQFQVYWNNTLVIDTGFRGSSTYNSQLNALGYPNVSGAGSGSATFNKSAATPTTALVIVTAPLVGTAWEFLMGCPPIAPTPTQTSTPSNTPSNTSTQTQTPTNTPTATQTPTPNACWNYILGPNTFSTTYEYWSCSTDQSNLIFVAANTTAGPYCSSRVPTGGVVTRQNVCGSIPPTPTATSTPTTTPTQTPTTTATAICVAPTLNSVTLISGSLFEYSNSTPTNCNAITYSYSRDQITWNNDTTGCVTTRQRDTGDATGTWFFRITQFCEFGGSSNSNVVSYTYPTPTPTQTPSNTATPTNTATQTPTQTPTTTTTLTATPTQTTTQTPTQTASQTPTTTTTLTSTPTQTSTQTPTRTATQTPTQTSSQTPTQTPTTTTTLTATPTQTASQTPTQTSTNTPTNTATNTPTPTNTNTPTNTQTPTQTHTQTSTQTPTNTPTHTQTPTQTQTSTPANTPTQTASETPTNTPTHTQTSTPTQTKTPTPTTTTTLTSTATPTQTATQTSTPTQTPSHTPTRPPIEFAENGFWYEEGTGELFAATNKIKRINWSGSNTGINSLNPTNPLTINITDGFRFIGMASGNEQNVLVADNEGVVYYYPEPGGTIDQTSFITLTGGTVSNNVITFVGQNDTANVTILEVYYENGTFTSNRIVRTDDKSLTFSGSNANQFKLTNLIEGSGNTIETGSGGTVNFRVDSAGNIFATSKSFIVPNQTKEGYNLRHGSLEGPENGVYFRGKTTASYIITPLEWEWLVDYDTVTVILTSNCGDDIYVKEISSTMITVGGNDCEYSYVVYGERKDIDKMNIDIEN